jgi:CheY-like chemotaxis protein
VIDTGIGIESGKLDTVFEKFTQADATITRKYGGTGLGLAITKNLVEMMDGSIKVESTPGQGTTFSVTLPLPFKMRSEMFEAVGEPVKIKKKKPNKRSERRILLVEDYAPNARVAGTFIEEYGYACDIAVNGQQAIRMFMENNYDLVFMDIQMPGLDGYETTIAMRKYEKERGLAPTRIIGLTAYASTKDRDKCLGAGMDDYLSKPFEPKKLREILQGSPDQPASAAS